MGNYKPSHIVKREEDGSFKINPISKVYGTNEFIVYRDYETLDVTDFKLLCGNLHYRFCDCEDNGIFNCTCEINEEYSKGTVNSILELMTEEEVDVISKREYQYE